MTVKTLSGLLLAPGRFLRGRPPDVGAAAPVSVARSTRGDRAVVTMRDVARGSGVSTMTVSNVLSGRRYVAPETRQRVLAEMARTGYRVNRTAQSLRRGRTGLVGLGVPEIDSDYFGMLGARLMQRLAQEGLRTVVEQTGASREGELATITDSRASAYDGLVLSAIGLSAGDVSALVGDLPVVLLGERQDMGGFDHVEMPNEEGAEAATRLLLDQGCRRLAVIGVPGLTPSAVPAVDAFRLRGLGVGRAVGGVSDARVVTVPAGHTTTLADGRRLMTHALQQQPSTDGVFCVTDTLALGALRALADHGRRVPDDVRLVGFDDVPEAAHSVPSLTSVAPDHDAMVEATVRLLLRRMGDRSAPPEHFVGTFTLARRESTGTHTSTGAAP